MNTQTKKPLLKAIVEQVTNNTTSWIGHHTFDNKDIIGGQTFIVPSEGELAAIEVFTSIVTTPGNVLMTVHTFDSQLKSWGPVLGSASVDFNRTDTGKWKSFNISGLHLNKGKAYGFRLESSNCFIGVGETVGSYETPLSTNGQEWKFINKDQKGQSFSYFSLAFKVDVRA
ncbi:MAG: hypothetical protein ABI707_17765 [Ferruginibacter sp.]